MRTIFSYLSPYKIRIAFGLLIKSVGTFAELFLPMIMAYMIDEVAPTENVTLLVVWGVIMLVCALAALFGNVIANRMASKVARDTTERVRKDLFSKTLALSSKQTDEITVPSLVSRLSSDTYNVHNSIGMMQRLGIRAPILVIGGHDFYRGPRSRACFACRRTFSYFGGDMGIETRNSALYGFTARC